LWKFESSLQDGEVDLCAGKRKSTSTPSITDQQQPLTTDEVTTATTTTTTTTSKTTTNTATSAVTSAYAAFKGDFW